MEKLDLRRSSCRAKVLGTIISVSGAFIVILYKGSVIFSTSSYPHQNNTIISQQSKWVFGGLSYDCNGVPHGSNVEHCSVKGPIFVAMFKPLGIAIAAVMVVIFLGDSLHIGSVIGSIIIAIGFYAVMWAQIKGNSTTLMENDVQSLHITHPKDPTLATQNYSLHCNISFMLSNFLTILEKLRQSLSQI